ncbi:MAG: transglutaminase-like domain-containing protein [Rhodospirillales bacterium]|nr:transglutaminase-like domain-containing protein [Rhodospirillales bacterium]
MSDFFFKFRKLDTIKLQGLSPIKKYRPKIIGLLILITFAGIVAWKGLSIVRFANFIFFDGPYLSRTLSEKFVIVESGTETWGKIISDSNIDTQIWHPVILSEKIQTRLTANFSEDEIERLSQFLSSYKSLITKNKFSKTLSLDLMVSQIVQLIYSQYSENESSAKRPDFSVFAEPPYRAENHLFQLVNRKTGCGTVAEATIALLRNAGIKTRLMGLTGNPEKITFGHVFVEYYSPEFKKWVMLDPMINSIPKRNGIPISTFETLKDTKARSQLNKIWGEKSARFGGSLPSIYNRLYTEESISFFYTSGPFQSVYLYAPNEEIRAVIKKRVSRGF